MAATHDSQEDLDMSGFDEDDHCTGENQDISDHDEYPETEHSGESAGVAPSIYGSDETVAEDDEMGDVDEIDAEDDFEDEVQSGEEDEMDYESSSGVVSEEEYTNGMGFLEEQEGSPAHSERSFVTETSSSGGSSGVSQSS